MKYDTQIADLKTKLAPAGNILIALPSLVTVDKLAAGLALYLSLKAASKNVAIVSADTLKVSQSNLFGLGEVKDLIPATNGGNLTLSLQGVVDNDGKVPALEKLDWYPQGTDLNLVFHVLPGQKFEPKNIVTSFAGGQFDLVFVLGAANLGDLGAVYEQNKQLLDTSAKVNIDNNPGNSLFGVVNIVDEMAASVSEMVINILSSLSLPIDGDLSTNIINGILDATDKLTNKASADTFMAIGSAMQAGGKLPQAATQPETNFNANQFMQATSQPVQPITNSVPVVPATPIPQPQTQQAQSQYEVPTGEQVSSGNPENPAPDWLTPKIYKGGSLG